RDQFRDLVRAMQATAARPETPTAEPARLISNTSLDDEGAVCIAAKSSAYVGSGSFSSDQPAPDALGMSASFRSRPNLRTAAIRREFQVERGGETGLGFKRGGPPELGKVRGPWGGGGGACRPTLYPALA